MKPHLSKEAAWKKAGKNADRDLILLLPGSRLMEIQKMLPTMLQAAKLILKKRPDTDFTMPRAKTIPLKMLEDMVKAAGVPVKIIEGDNYDVMFSADLALATSGTVTLERRCADWGPLSFIKPRLLPLLLHAELSIYLTSACQILLQANVFYLNCCRKNSLRNVCSRSSGTFGAGAEHADEKRSGLCQ